MLRFLGVLVVLAALVAGLGYYQGWWSFETTKDKGNFNINVTVDKEKFQKDTKKVVD